MPNHEDESFLVPSQSEYLEPELTEDENFGDYEDETEQLSPEYMQAHQGLPPLFRDTDVLLDRLIEADFLGRMAFGEFIGELNLGPGLRVESYMTMKRPEAGLICKIWAPDWMTDSVIVNTAQRLSVPDPSWHFNIHFEIHLQPHRGRMRLHLHYETNPYNSLPTLNHRMDLVSLGGYLSLRSEFFSLFSVASRMSHFRPVTDDVQVGTAEYNLVGKPVSEVRDWIEPMILSVADVVDQVLRELRRRRDVRIDTERLRLLAGRLPF